MENCSLPIEILIEIAEYHWTIYGALLESCKEAHDVFKTTLDPWKLFTRNSSIASFTSIDIYTTLLGVKSTNFTHVSKNYNRGNSGRNATICLYKRGTCKYTINTLYIDTNLTRYRILRHFHDRNELSWSNRVECQRLILTYYDGRDIDNII
ncbi:hypothetical protein D5b_00479 [Faustovirus]|nr:hypothetical protein D5b_00479 [Faustovirus]AMN84440.1 hypothetical protein D6_00029 [Faustovirus]AMP44418.1 hypothetical protein PRJ_Dakar_00467 [Faustovirus]